MRFYRRLRRRIPTRGGRRPGRPRRGPHGSAATCAHARGSRRYPWHPQANPAAKQTTPLDTTRDTGNTTRVSPETIPQRERSSLATTQEPQGDGVYGCIPRLPQGITGSSRAPSQPQHAGDAGTAPGCAAGPLRNPTPTLWPTLQLPDSSPRPLEYKSTACQSY